MYRHDIRSTCVRGVCTQSENRIFIYAFSGIYHIFDTHSIRAFFRYRRTPGRCTYSIYHHICISGYR
jgi:hypothetical protein